MPILIGDHNWQEVRKERGILPRYLEYGSPLARSYGLVPVRDYPDLLIPEDQWKERIAEAHAKQTMPVHHFRKHGVPPKSQGGTNYCWAYGIASAVEAVRLLEAQEYVRLAPATLGWTVDWRNVGNWCSDAIEGVAERGVASFDYAGDGIHNPRSFRPGWEQDALQYKLSEWFDTEPGSTLRMMRQCVSLLLAGLPLYAAYNWWGHAVMIEGVEWDERHWQNVRWLVWNSHGDGHITMSGSRGVPDEAYAPRSSTHRS